MGVVELLSLAVSAGSAIARRNQARKAAAATNEANAVSTATGEINNRLARRRAAREERLRRARLKQSASNYGVSGSSGEFGALSALQANSQTNLANQNANEVAARGISAANQRAANAQTSIERISAFEGLAQRGLSLADDHGLFDQQT